MKYFRSGIGLFLVHYVMQIALAVICATTIELIPLYWEWWMTLHAILVAPVKETILYQFIPKLVLDMLGIRNYWIALLLMTLLFTSIHVMHSIQDNIIFSLTFMAINALLINYYLQVQKQESTISAIVKTVILHSLYNLTLVML